MIIQPDHELFDHIYWLLFTSRGDEHHKKSYSCTILSAILASYFLRFTKDSIYIIDSDNHSVVYDGISTWDLQQGVVFKNYKYPCKTGLPSTTSIPTFSRFYKQNLFDMYYTKDSLMNTSNLSVKKLTNM
jgi:hypothetical protein